MTAKIERIPITSRDQWLALRRQDDGYTIMETSVEGERSMTTDTTTAADPKAQYDFWRRRLNGETLPIHDGEVQAGFYRTKRRDGGFDPVAYWWQTDGTLRCRIGGKDVSEQVARERWIWASKHPITYDLYKAVVSGEPWPDQHEAVTRSNQAPSDDSFDGLRDAIEDLAREANALVAKGAAQNQDEADRASDLANKLAEFQAKADGRRKDEKRPHDDAARAVQAKWAPLLDVAEVYRRVKLVVVTPFLNKKAEAERKAREEAAKAGEPIPEPARSTTKAGTRGRSVALRTVKQVEITDRAALIAFFSDSQQMTEFLQAAAEKAVRAGVTPPGVKITESKVAA